MTASAHLFETLAPTWWDEEGPFAILHRLTPHRIQWVLDAVRTLSVSNDVQQPLKGLRILDVGCGGGLVCEPLRRLGAEVVGHDIVPESLEVARDHAEKTGLDITYTLMPPHEMQPHSFDVIIAYEVLEHVEKPEEFLRSLTPLLSEHGVLIMSTLNRTLASYALGIVVAERVVRWAPPGTHSWHQFIRPRELQDWLRQQGFDHQTYQGLVYRPLTQRWSWSSNLSVNYFVAAYRHKKGIQHLDGELSSWG